MNWHEKKFEPSEFLGWNLLLLLYNNKIENRSINSNSKWQLSRFICDLFSTYSYTNKTEALGPFIWTICVCVYALNILLFYGQMQTDLNSIQFKNSTRPHRGLRSNVIKINKQFEQLIFQCIQRWTISCSPVRYFVLRY